MINDNKTLLGTALFYSRLGSNKLSVIYKIRITLPCGNLKLNFQKFAMRPRLDMPVVFFLHRFCSAADG